MAGSRGYSSYRGRTPKSRIILAVVLVLVILAALAVIRMQRYIVYDEHGRPHLELPWQTEGEAPPEEDGLEDIDLVIQGPERPAAVFAFTAAEAPLTRAGWQAAWTAAASGADAPYNAAAVTVKDGDGLVYFDSAAAVSGAVRTQADTAAALGELVGGEASLYSVARMSCFRDPRAAMADVEGMGLKNTGGFIFYDGENRQWLDPAKPAARQYLCGLARELAELGFDEILLTDVSYPTVGKLDKIAYGETGKTQNLTAFLEELRAALEPYDTALSIEVPEAVIAQGSDGFAGLDLAAVAPLVDRIYAPAQAARAAELEALVAAASPRTAFVPELTAPEADMENSGGFLVLG